MNPNAANFNNGANDWVIAIIKRPAIQSSILSHLCTEGVPRITDSHVAGNCTDWVCITEQKQRWRPDQIRVELLARTDVILSRRVVKSLHVIAVALRKNVDNNFKRL